MCIVAGRVLNANFTWLSWELFWLQPTHLGVVCSFLFSQMVRAFRLAPSLPCSFFHAVQRQFPGRSELPWRQWLALGRNFVDVRPGFLCTLEVVYCEFAASGWVERLRLRLDAAGEERLRGRLQFLQGRYPAYFLPF